MSVVCGKVCRDKIVMCADSIVVRGWSKEPTNKNFTKMDRINGMIIGGVGYAQETSLLYQFAKTHQPLEATDRSVLDFIVEFCKYQSGLTNCFGINNDYLIAFQGKLFSVENMFVREIKDYFSIGAGADFSNSALFLGHTPQEAVKTACALSCMVAEPLIVEEMFI